MTIEKAVVCILTAILLAGEDIASEDVPMAVASAMDIADEIVSEVEERYTGG